MEAATIEIAPLTPENASARASALLASVPPYPGTFSGRGVVICAGGARYLTCAWVLINMLRRFGCTLPVEVWYLGDKECDPDWIELVAPLGVRCIDAREVGARLGDPPDSAPPTGSFASYTPHPRLDGWQSKPFAILHSAFEEVLFLDADNLPVVDPIFLFDLPEYRSTGAIFWPDNIRTSAADDAWRVFGIPYRDEWEQESGQLVIDKRRCWPALCLCNWYNRNAHFYYRYVYGDKDTFRFAWYSAKAPFAMPDGIRYLPHTICQG